MQLSSLSHPYAILSFVMGNDAQISMDKFLICGHFKSSARKGGMFKRIVSISLEARHMHGL